MVLAARQRLLLAFAAIHAAMFGYDLHHPERFLFTDRAGERMDTVRGFLDLLHGGGDLAGFLATHGVPGDWLPQALLYFAGGQFLVIAAQIALALLSISCVYRLGIAVRLGEGGAIAAAALYGLLPHTLVLPHQLASEAIFIPLVVLGFALPVGAGSGLALGAATLVRPVPLLWLPLHPFFEKGAARWRTLFLLAALGPMLGWMGFIYLASGEVSMGRSSHDVGHNLYVRAHRMAASLPEEERPAERPAGQTTMSVREYLGFVARHPDAAASHGVRDVFTLSVKSGIERLVLDYLDLFPGSRAALQDSNEGWRVQVERHGLRAALAQMWRTQAGLVFVSGLAAAFFVAFMALALVGAFSTNRLRLLLAGFVLYVFFTAQAIDAAQSRHRAPAEFALCVLAVAGWARMRAALAVRAPAPRPVMS